MEKYIVQGMEKGVESFYAFSKYATILSSLFLCDSKFSELHPFDLLYRQCYIRMLDQISQPQEAKVPIPCLMTTQELSRKYKHRCGWKRLVFLTQKHTSYFNESKEQFVLEPNMRSSGLVTQIQVAFSSVFSCYNNSMTLHGKRRKKITGTFPNTLVETSGMCVTIRWVNLSYKPHIYHIYMTHR